MRLTRSNAIDTEAVYAPDGRHIYFVSDRGGGPQIYRVRPSASPVERITFDGNYNISPAISPDGTLLAYVTRRGGAFKLMTLELAGGTRAGPDRHSATTKAPASRPTAACSCTPRAPQGSDVLMTTTLDGKIKTRLLSSGADMREPAWGPFGR